MKGQVTDHLELLNDLDNLILNINLQLPGFGKSVSKPIVHLKDYIIDIQNMVAYVWSAKNIIKVHVKLIRTKNNDRRRSTQSCKRGNGFDFEFVNALKDTFAEESA